MSTWIPDDQHGYSIAICACEAGPHLGARKAGTPCCCEGCGFMTKDQFDFLRAALIPGYADLAPETVPPATSPGPVTGRIILCGNTCEHDHEGLNSPSGCCAEHGPYLYYCGDCHDAATEETP